MSEQDSTPTKSEDVNSKNDTENIQQEQMTTNLTTDDIDFKVLTFIDYLFYVKV